MYNEIKEAVDSSSTMSEAANKLNMSFSTFKRKAIKFDLYKPNQGRKGIKREFYEDEKIRIPLNKILNGEFPFYSRTYLKKRLLRRGILKNECKICGISEWMGKEIKCQLDHIDGDSTNHKLENLRMLCPNCHTQTETFSNKKKSKRSISYTKEEFIKAVSESNNYSDVKKKLNLSLNGNNKTIKRLMSIYNLKFNQ